MQVPLPSNFPVKMCLLCSVRLNDFVDPKLRTLNSAVWSRKMTISTKRNDRIQFEFQLKMVLFPLEPLPRGVFFLMRNVLNL